MPRRRSLDIKPLFRSCACSPSTAVLPLPSLLEIEMKTIQTLRSRSMRRRLAEDLMRRWFGVSRRNAVRYARFIP